MAQAPLLQQNERMGTARARHARNSEFAHNAQEKDSKMTRETLATPIIPDTTIDALAKAADDAAENRKGMLDLLDFGQAETRKIVTRGAGSVDVRSHAFVVAALENRHRWALSKKGLLTLTLAVFPLPDPDVSKPLTRAHMAPVTYARWKDISPVIEQAIQTVNLPKATSPAKPGQIRVVAVSSPESAKGAGKSFTLQITK